LIKIKTWNYRKDQV